MANWSSSALQSEKAEGQRKSSWGSSVLYDQGKVDKYLNPVVSLAAPLLVVHFECPL